VFFVTDNFWPHNTTLFVTDFHTNNPRWTYFLLKTISKKDHSGKSAVPGVDRKDLFDIRVAVPTVGEQRQIVDAIESETARLVQQLANATAAISLAREYRTRLIADVVTGKFDVREAAASLPEEPDEPESMEQASEDIDGEVPIADTDPAIGEIE
jgi:type I restriction enzyme S subunit